MNLIEPSLLVSPVNSGLTKSISSKDGTLSFYLNIIGGDFNISGGIFGSQTIKTIPISTSDQSFLVQNISEINDRITLKLEFVDNYQNSDISVFYDTNIDLDDPNVLGLALSNSNNERYWWEIIIDSTKLQDNSYLRYALLHEIAHTLGLEHPFDNQDGDIYKGIISPWDSAFPEDTVMAYRAPRTGSWPQSLTENDLTALELIWGKNIQSNNKFFDSTSYGSLEDDRLLGLSGALYKSEYINGSLGNDTLVGFRGADFLIGGAGNDELRAGSGRDTLAGGLGNDNLYGGFGLNTFKDENDDYQDNLYIKSDQFAYNWIYNTTNNNSSGEKVDIIEGLDANDRIFIQGVSTLSLSFKTTDYLSPLGVFVSGIGIYSSNYLEAIYIGKNLSINDFSYIAKGLT